MAKYSGTLSYKGLVVKVDDEFIVIEQKKINKDTTIEESHNLSEKLQEYVGKSVSLTIKEDTELEPIDSVEE